MINEKCKQDVINFLREYKSPSVILASTMIDGHVVCIKPIPTICGAELMCSYKTERHLRELMRQPEITE